MQRDAFALMAQAERDHWWFRARREFIAAAIRRAAPPAMARVLDAGCGSGGNLALLAEFGSVHGFEFDHDARGVAAALGIGEVAHGSLPDGIPFRDTQFDVIGLFDVLEHLEHPVPALRALRGRLAPSAALVLMVPANPSLWGPHDVAHQHFRRYTSRSLADQLQAAGFSIEYLSYFNTLLLPLAVLQRIRERLFGYSVTSLTPAPLMNEVLLRIWRLERRWIPSRTLPVGLSLLAIARPAGDRT